jgi:hypothetical protein
METVSVKRLARVALAATLVLCLSACLFAPGRFTSDLDIRRSGEFTFSYTGELLFLPLMEKPQAEEKFEPEACHDDDFEERDCTAEELAEQKSNWEAEKASRTERQKREAESAKALLGGIDPSDPRSAEELAERLSRQAGWKRVDYRGDGVFDVEYTITSKLDHDFVFPTLERFAMANALVQISRRSDGTVRIDAPGYGQASNMMGGLGGLMRSAAQEGGSGSEGDDQPVTDGRFTIRTDAAILANNTDEGPKPDPAGQRLDWNVSARTPAAPTALLRLTQ